jgi:PIN domain nuclease of toxin-antitoxin system
MLIAQAQAEGLELITADARLAEYGVRTVNALR